MRTARSLFCGPRRRDAGDAMGCDGGFVTVQCACVIGEDPRAVGDGDEAQTDYGFEKVEVSAVVVLAEERRGRCW
jgi:hypothetical protein